MTIENYYELTTSSLSQANMASWCSFIVPVFNIRYFPKSWYVLVTPASHSKISHFNFDFYKTNLFTSCKMFFVCRTNSGNFFQVSTNWISKPIGKFGILNVCVIWMPRLCCLFCLTIETFEKKTEQASDRMLGAPLWKIFTKTEFVVFLWAFQTPHNGIQAWTNN